MKIVLRKQRNFLLAPSLKRKAGKHIRSQRKLDKDTKNVW